MKIKLLFVLFLFATFINSCTSDPTGNGMVHTFYNLKGYFKEEVERLEKENKELNKTILKDGNEESIRVKDVDWNTELLSFATADINKPALYSAYQTDSTISGNQLTVHYSARDSTPLIREITIKFKNNRPDTITITRVMSNSYVYSTEIMNYYGDGNFEINVDNKPVAGKKISFMLKGVAVDSHN
jgi:hypothetical protein